MPHRSVLAASLLVAGMALSSLPARADDPAAVLAGVVAAAPLTAADSVPAAFIGGLGTQALAVIRSDMPLREKADYFQRMIRQDFDLGGLCRFVLGPYWRVATAPEKSRFCDLFVDDLIRFYGQRLAQAAGGNFIVAGSRSNADGVVVTSRIVRPQDAPLAVDWRLAVTNGLYKIEDVAIDGVSMALAQRSEIASAIARDGGQIGLLLATMRE